MAKVKVEIIIKEPTKVTKTRTGAPSEMIREAIEKGVNLEQLEKLLSLQERYEANEAKKAYTRALSEFKRETPEVKRDKKNKQYDSVYASKGNLLGTINPILSKFGLSASFSYKNLPEKIVETTCHLTHEQGHRESVSFSAPADISGAKNPIQQLKSTTTYLEKITFSGILGIESTEEIDDDGAGVVEFIDEIQLKQVMDLIALKQVDVKKFCKAFKIEEVVNLPKDKFQQAITMLNAKVVK